MAHAVDCAAVGHHEARAARSDVRVSEILSGKPDPDGAASGGNGTKSAQHQGGHHVAIRFAALVEAGQCDQRPSEAQYFAAVASRNSSLAHHRTTVLLV